jgi:hypothetical protein
MVVLAVHVLVQMVLGEVWCQISLSAFWLDEGFTLNCFVRCFVKKSSSSSSSSGSGRGSGSGSSSSILLLLLCYPCSYSIPPAFIGLKSPSLSNFLPQSMFYLKFSYNFISLYFVHEMVNSGTSQDKIYWSHSYHSSQKSSFVEPVAIREPCLSQHHAISTTACPIHSLKASLFGGHLCPTSWNNKCVYIYITTGYLQISNHLCVVFVSYSRMFGRYLNDWHQNNVRTNLVKTKTKKIKDLHGNSTCSRRSIWD